MDNLIFCNLKVFGGIIGFITGLLNWFYNPFELSKNLNFFVSVIILFVIYFLCAIMYNILGIIADNLDVEVECELLDTREYHEMVMINPTGSNKYMRKFEHPETHQLKDYFMIVRTPTELPLGIMTDDFEIINEDINSPYVVEQIFYPMNKFIRFFCNMDCLTHYEIHLPNEKFDNEEKK